MIEFLEKCMYSDCFWFALALCGGIWLFNKFYIFPRRIDSDLCEKIFEKMCNLDYTDNKYDNQRLAKDVCEKYKPFKIGLNNDHNNFFCILIVHIAVVYADGTRDIETEVDRVMQLASLYYDKNYEINLLKSFDNFVNSNPSMYTIDFIRFIGDFKKASELYKYTYHTIDVLLKQGTVGR